MNLNRGSDPLSSRPGFGWASSSDSTKKVILYPKSLFIDDSYDEDMFSSNAPAEFIREAIGANDGNITSEQFSSFLCALILRKSASDPFLSEDFDEFRRMKSSNGRTMRWNIIRVAPNTAFPIHAHQNIEVIYAIQGTVYEYRLQGEPLCRTFALDDCNGPNIQHTSAPLQFKLRCFGAAALTSNELSNQIRGTGINDNWENPLDERCFLLNEKGSIHLSYTGEDGALLLVLWSGGHGNISRDNWPRSGEVENQCVLPTGVVPM